MLLAINDKIKGVLGYFVVGLITIPFTLWGIQSYLGDDSPLIAASVNDVEITTQEFNNSVSRLRQNLQKKYEGNVPYRDVTLKKQVIEQLIDQRLLENVSDTKGYRVSDRVLFENIRNTKDFQREGVFNREYYNTILASNGKSPTLFEASLRKEIQVEQLRLSILKSSFVTKKELDRFASLQNQKREFTYVVYSSDNTSIASNVSDKDVLEYYQNNTAKFMSPEQVKIEYLEIKSDDLTTDMIIDEDKIKVMYEDYLADISQKEERKTRHILLTVNDGENKSDVKLRLQTIRKQIMDGASFEAVAKKNSMDPGSAQQGGDLDWVEKGQMTKPFAKVLFAMKEGDVSDIVETQFGFHLIKLDKIRSEKVLPLADKRTSFIAEIKEEAASDEFYDVVENLAATTYENTDSLDVAADILNLKIHTTGLFSQQTGTGIAKNEKVRQAVFSEAVLEKGENSEVIEITPNHAVVVRVAEHVPAKPMPLENVSNQIKITLANSEKQKQMLASAYAAKAKFNDGVSLDSIITKALTIQKSGPVNKRDVDKVNLSILDFGFKMRMPDNGKKSAKVIKLLSGDVALLILDKIINPVNLDKDALAASSRQLSSFYAQSDLDSVLATLLKGADIYRNQKVIEE